MSSSAFTPSTTTVTNNVPVNVPVVTDWVTYTPTWSSDGTAPSIGNGTIKAQWRRIGSSAEIQIEITAGSTTTFGTNFLKLSLPSAFTANSNYIGNGQLIGFGQIYNSLSSAHAITAQINTIAANDFYWVSNSGLITGTSPLTLGSTSRIKFYLFYEVAQWAGSGTTTLATRAVEEYASNSSTSDASDTTSFVYGPNGATTPGPLTAYRTKRVRFQTPILSTDSIYLEGRASLTSPWAVVQALDGGNGLSPLQLQAGVYYGIGLNASLINSTDIDVSFGRYAFSNGATYGAAGAQWSTSLGYWRVRKVSSGAQVGYPVSARNIVGDTSGSVVPVGMLGELKEASNLAVTAIYSVNSASVATLSLGTGTWLVMNNISGYHSTRPTSGIGGTTLQITSNGVEVARADSIALYYSSAVAESIPDWYCSMQTVITVPSGSTYNVVSVLNAVQNSGTPSNFATTTRPTDKMRAIRIA